MKNFLIGLMIAALLGLSYFMFFYDDEPDPFEPHPIVIELLESYKIAENYQVERDRVDTTYYLGESVSILVENNEVILVITGEGLQTILRYSLDETMITRNTRLYYETSLYSDDQWMIEDEAWGQDFNSDDYVQLDISNEGFIETLKELTIEDWLFFQREFR